MIHVVMTLALWRLSTGTTAGTSIAHSRALWFVGPPPTKPPPTTKTRCFGMVGVGPCRPGRSSSYLWQCSLMTYRSPPCKAVNTAKDFHNRRAGRVWLRVCASSSSADVRQWRCANVSCCFHRCARCYLLPFFPPFSPV